VNGTTKTISTYEGVAAIDLEHAVLLTGPRAARKYAGFEKLGRCPLA